MKSSEQGQDVQEAGDGGGEHVLDAAAQTRPGMLVVRDIVVRQVQGLQTGALVSHGGVKPLLGVEVVTVRLRVVAGSKTLDVRP